jgi:hypothetical protein
MTVSRVVRRTDVSTANHQGVSGRKSASRRGRTTVAITAPVVLLDDKAAREAFAAVISEHDPADIAKAARSTKEAARQYIHAKRFPDARKLISMARTLPTVKAWLYHEVERTDEGFDSDRALTGAHARIAELARMPGKEGDAARTLLRDMARMALE